jgi:hypothetical protein
MEKPDFAFIVVDMVAAVASSTSSPSSPPRRLLLAEVLLPLQGLLAGCGGDGSLVVPPLVFVVVVAVAATISSSTVKQPEKCREMPHAHSTCDGATRLRFDCGTFRTTRQVYAGASPPRSGRAYSLGRHLRHGGRSNGMRAHAMGAASE